jgi:hypothetical protein
LRLLLPVIQIAQLNKLPDADMLTKAEIDGIVINTRRDILYQALPGIKRRSGFAGYQQPEQGWHLVFIWRTAYVKKYARTLPEMSVTLEDYLKLERLLDDKMM